MSGTFHENFVTFKEFQDLLGLKKSSMYKLINEDKLPKTVELFGTKKIWKRSTVEDFINSLE